MHAGKQRVLIGHSLGTSAVVLSLVEAARANKDSNVDAIMLVDPVMGPSVTGAPSVRTASQNPKTEQSSKPKTMCAATPASPPPVLYL